MRVLACTILLAVAVCGCGGPAHPPSEPSVANPVQGKQTLPSTGRTTAQPPPSTARARTASAASLRALGIAMLEYADDHGCLPPAAVHGKGGQPLLSWRVLLLPY